MASDDWDKFIFWKDIDVFLRKNQEGDVSSQENKAAILNSVYNILTTEPGDRRMLPTFACGLRSLLFEPIDHHTSQLIADKILGALSTWEPRINVLTTKVEAHIDQGYYKAHIVFEILKSNEQVVLEFPIKKLS